jgi:tetratricopeptide (TPR) repeat protein/aminoglycoside phosphotransferase (APT) family kinase protein
MTPDRRERLKEILSVAMKLDGDARERYIDANCGGDGEMRRETDELIAAWCREDDFLEEPLFRVPEAFVPESMEGRRLGPYRLVRRIGRGGMGAVYLAEREDGEFTRQAAIKIVRPGFDSEEMLRHFRRERQILASLAHPNIGMLLDGGATEDGTPYFVMEYIDGQPILDWVRTSGPPIERRMALFQSICSAVGHAHRNLVVHGDIKPANILVTAEGVPKLLDFGIARLTGREEDTGAPVGWTPKFASPEQLRGEPINTVSDVYSLGVLLGEIILDRQAEARELNDVVRMATSPDPAHRYPTVEAMATDVQRYLDGKAVSAHPATPWYRLRKFVRRHRWQAAFAVLLVGILSWKIVTDQIHAVVLRAERDRAHRRFEDVRGLANSLIFDIEGDVALLKGGTAVRAKLVTRAVAYLDGLSRESSGDPALQKDLADAYEKLGDVQGRPGSANLGQTELAAESYRKAIALRVALTVAAPENLAWRQALATTYSRLSAVLQDMGHFQQALDFERKVLAIRQSLLAAAPTAERELNVALTYTTLGAALAQVGDWGGVLEARQKALELYKAIVVRDPTNGSNRRGLGLAESRLGGILLRNRDLPAATVHYREALRIESELAAENPSDPRIGLSLASAHVALGGALYESSDYAGALASYRNALQIQEPISASDPSDARSSSLLSTTLQRMSATLVKSGSPKKAWPYAERCLQLRRRVAEANPANAGARGDVVTALATAGEVRAAMGDRAEARRWYTDALSLFAELQKRGKTSANLNEEARRATVAMAALAAPEGRR